MRIFNLFKKEKRRKLLCEKCKKEIFENEAQWIGKHSFCQNCAHTQNNPISFTQATRHQAEQSLKKSDLIDESVSTKTFICSECGKTLAIKYVHKSNICANCANKRSTSNTTSSNSSHISNHSNCDYEIILPKTLFTVSDISTDLPGDNVSRRWENVIIDERGLLRIEQNSITYSAHSIGHNTGRHTTYRSVSFDQLPKLILQSADSAAAKYVGMNQTNWKEYVKET